MPDNLTQQWRPCRTCSCQNSRIMLCFLFLSLVPSRPNTTHFPPPRRPPIAPFQSHSASRRHRHSNAIQFIGAQPPPVYEFWKLIFRSSLYLQYMKQRNIFCSWRMRWRRIAAALNWIADRSGFGWNTTCEDSFCFLSIACFMRSWKMYGWWKASYALCCRTKTCLLPTAPPSILPRTFDPNAGDRCMTFHTYILYKTTC